MSRILLVDDDESFRKMLHETLQRAGYQVQDAANGKVALKLYRQEPADLIITDIFMPEKEGLETIMEVRRINPNVKIIAISGEGRGGPIGYLQIAKQLGAKRALVKPFSSKEVLETVAQVLSEDGSLPMTGPLLDTGVLPDC